MVTAEAALVLPVLVVVTGMLLWALAVATAQLRCVDAAGLSARAAARGEAAAGVTAAARDTAPAGATVEVSVEGDLVHVTVSARVGHLTGSFARVTSVVVHAEATAHVEPSDSTVGADTISRADGIGE